MSKVQIQNFKERDVEKINNPRRFIFLTDILSNAIIYTAVLALIAGAIFSVCAICDLGFRLMGV